MAEGRGIGRLDVVLNLFILLVVLVGALNASPIYSGKFAAGEFCFGCDCEVN